ncbi:MAG: ABC transporter ATP-binding protein [Desulfarculaceae bacterium]|nr:ABC transporter ATP-binding protein [Desulfarculaceae bacterium]
MISLQGISKTFSARDGSSVAALKDISLEVQSGQFVSLVGPSGCGKTTLLEIIAGLEKPSSGQVRHGNLTQGGQFGWAGYMSQTDTLLPWRTVLENAAIGLEIRGVAKAERRRRVAGLVERVGLAGFEDKYPGELSGGMKKRLGLIRMLAYEPQVLLLDEPFAALDAQTRERLQADLLDLWRDFKRTVIFVTHDLVEAITLSDRILLLGSRPARIKREYGVDLPRPRLSQEIQFSEEFQDLHRRLRQNLLDEAPPGGNADPL